MVKFLRTTDNLGCKGLDRWELEVGVGCFGPDGGTIKQLKLLNTKVLIIVIKVDLPNTCLIQLI